MIHRILLLNHTEQKLLGAEILYLSARYPGRIEFIERTCTQAYEHEALCEREKFFLALCPRLTATRTSGNLGFLPSARSRKIVSHVRFSYLEGEPLFGLYRTPRIAEYGVSHYAQQTI